MEKNKEQFIKTDIHFFPGDQKDILMKEEFALKIEIISNEEWIKAEKEIRTIKIIKEIDEETEIWKLNMFDSERKTNIHIKSAKEKVINWEKLIEQEIKNEIYNFVESNDANFKDKDKTFIVLETESGYNVTEETIKWTPEEKELIEEIIENKDEENWLNVQTEKMKMKLTKRPFAMAYRLIILIVCALNISNEKIALSCLVFLGVTLIFDYIRNSKIAKKTTELKREKIKEVEIKGFSLKLEAEIDKLIENEVKKFII